MHSVQFAGADRIYKSMHTGLAVQFDPVWEKHLSALSPSRTHLKVWTA